MVIINCGTNGLLLAAYSSLIFAICSLIAKNLSNVHPVQLCLYGFFGVSILSFCEVVKSNEVIIPRGCGLLILIRSICGCLFFILSFYSVQIMPLGDASVLLYTTPLWTLILANIFLKEPCKTSNLLSVCIAMFGVIFVTQPEIIFGKDEDSSEEISKRYSLGATSAVIASISEATGNVVLRKLKHINPCVILFNYSLFSVFFCFIFGYTFNYLSVPQDNYLLIVTLSLLTLSEQYLMAVALTLEHAGPVAIVQASDIIYGYILEVMFYNEEVNLLSLLGAIIVGVVVINMATSKISSQQINCV